MIIEDFHTWQLEMEHYFKPVHQYPLPTLTDLTKVLPTSFIKLANKHIKDTISKDNQRQKYQKVFEFKTKIANYAAEYGIMTAV